MHQLCVVAPPEGGRHLSSLRQHAGIKGLEILLRCQWDYVGLNKDDLISTVLNFVKSNPSVAVRFAATNCLSKMCVQFAPDLQKNMHSTIIPPLLLNLDENNNPPISMRVMTCGALISFMSNSEPDIVLTYSDAILGRLVNLMRRTEETDGVMAAVTAIGSFAQSVGAHFARYYSMITGLLQALFSKTSDSPSFHR